jgi:hypothetical protein
VPLPIIFIFLVGYIAIAFESFLKVNKSAIAILMGVLCWAFVMLNTSNGEMVSVELSNHFSRICEILFFLDS